MKKYILIFIVGLLAISCGGGGGSSDEKLPYSETNPESSDTSAPFIEKVTAISQSKIIADFSEGINFASAEELSNYSIQGDQNIINVTVVNEGEDSDKIELTLDSIMIQDADYTLTVTNIEDYSGNKIDNFQINFKGKGIISAEISPVPVEKTNLDQFEIYVTGSDIVDYRYKLNQNDWSEILDVNTPIQLSNLDEGVYHLEVVGRDSFGNWQDFSNSSSYEWSIDKTPPEIIVENAPASISNQNNISLSVTGDDLAASKYSLDSGEWINADSNRINLEGLSDGNHSLKVIGSDTAGNWQSVDNAYLINWQVDTSTPIAQIVNAPDTYTSSRNFSIDIDGEKISSYKYRYTGNTEWSDAISTSENISLNSLSDGQYFLEVIGINTAGSIQPEVSATRVEWNVDTTAPNASIESNVSEVTNNNSPSFIVSGLDVVRYKYRVDGGDWSGLNTVSDSISTANLVDGLHKLEVVGYDRAGNEQLTPTSATWTVDTTAPIAQITSSVGSLTNSQSVELTISSISEQAVKYRIKVDSEEYSESYQINDGTVKHVLENLTEGAHTVSVIVSDQIGNWQNVSEASVYEWTIDLTPPEFIVNNYPSKLTSSNTALVSVDSEEVITYVYRLNSGEWSSAIQLQNNIELAGLADGTQLLEIKGIDAAGNISNAVSYDWTVDTTAPTAVIEEGPVVYTNVNSAQIIIKTDDTVAYKYNVDGNGWSDEINSAVIIDLNDLSEGPHGLEIIAKDTAGNWQNESDSTKLIWNVDLTNPSVNIISNQPSLTNQKDISFEISSDDGIKYVYSVDDGLNWSEEVSITESIVLNELQDGQNKINVKTIDRAGNISDSQFYTWTVDTVAPVAPAVTASQDIVNGLTLVYNWVMPDDAVSTRIQVATDPDFQNIVLGSEDGSVIENGSSLNYSVNPNNGAYYYARVKVKDAAGNWSSSFGDSSSRVTVVGSISGAVKDSFGNELSGAFVKLLDSNGNIFQTSETSANASFDFRSVAIGSNYSLTVSKTAFNEATKSNISVNAGSVTNQGTIYLVSTSASSGKVIGSVVEANDGSAINDAVITIYDYKNEPVKVMNLTTSTFESDLLNPGTYSVEVSKSNYFNLRIDNVMIDGDANIGAQSICEQLTGDMVRVILLWGESPRDMDLHVVGPTSQSVTSDGEPSDRFHIFFSKKSYDDNDGTYLAAADSDGTSSTASLVLDDTNKYGPEAINLFDFGNGYANGTYTYTVHNWSKDPWQSSPITIRIFDNEGLVREIPFPSDLSAEEWYWKSFQLIVNGSGRANRTIKIESTLATLDYQSKSSMNWELSGSRLTAYLLNLSATEKILMFGLLIVLSFAIGFITVITKRKLKHLA